MTTTAIGFSNKYYTLWQIEEETRPLGNGCNYVVTHYYYIKNISFDKDKALAKYPNASLDENLRGKTASWSSRPKEVWTNVDVFRFGKYKFEKIEENTDTDYLTWYWEQIYDDHKDYVLGILKNRGYVLRTNEFGYSYLMSPEMLKKEELTNNFKKQMINKFNNHENIQLHIECNPDFDGEININDITYKFEEVKENYYQGFEYYLPVLNGKAKRIKNKDITITNYEVIYLDNNNESILVVIKDFIVNK